MQNFIVMFTFSILDLFRTFCSKIDLAFWCCLINLPVVQSQRLEASDFPCRIIIYSFPHQFFLHNYRYCYNKKQPSGGVLQKGVLQISHNSQENTCPKDLILMKLQIYKVNNFIKKRIPAHIFCCKFYEISHNTHFF